jgi:opacity protein-like surface antigen
MKKKLLVAALFAFVGTSAMAQSSTFKPGFYAGIELGYAQVEDQTQETATALVSSLGGRATVTQDSAVFDGRIFGGYKIIENIDFELGLAQSSTVSQTVSGVSGGSVSYTGKADISYSGVDYSVLLRPSISTGLNNLYVRVGGTYLTQKQDVSLSTSGYSASSALNTSGSGYILGVGYDIPVSKSVDIRAAYNYLGNIAGISNNYTNRFSIGVLGKF